MFSNPPFLRRLPSKVRWVGIFVVLFLTNQIAHGQELWPTPPGGVNFTVPEHQIQLADEGMKPEGRATIVHGYSHPVNGGFSPYTNKTVWVSRPSKGEVVQSGNTFYYYPYRNREGSDSFIYLARSTVNPDNNVSYQVNILIEKGFNDQPVLQLDNDTDGGTYLFYLNEEEDTVIEKINILDPDFTGDSVELTIEDNQYFELVGPVESDSLKQSYVTQSGKLYTWDLKWKNGLPPDYEGLAIDDRSWGPFTLSFNDSSQSIQTFDLEVRLNQIWEEMISEGDPANESILVRNGTEENASELITASANGLLTYNLVESDGLELKIPIRLYSPDSEKYQLYYKCDLNDSVYPEFPLTVGFYNENTPSTSSLSLVASTQNTETFNNSSFDDVLSAPWDNNDFGYLSVSFIDDNFNSNINEPLEIELWAVPGLDSTGNRGGNTLVGKFVINVEDDLNDPVIFKTDNLTGFQGSGESESDRILFEISENQPWSYDFYFDDPDMEFSRGQNGANPLVSITDAVSFQYSLNELQNKITLSYTGLPDYESRYQGSNDKNNYYLSLVIQDAEDGFSPLKDTLFLKVRVEDNNDDPYISEGTVYPADVDPITVSGIGGDYDYNISLQSILENQRLDISELLLDQLQVRDEDTEDIGDTRVLDAITWEVLRFPEKGNLYSGSDDVLLSESSNVVSSDSGRITKLFYQPSLNEIGDDQFALNFFDSSGEENSVLFNIFIINEQSTPLLDRILVNHDIAKDMDLNDMQFIPTLKEYTVFVNDGERPVVDLVFDDRSDNELISSILLLEDQASRTALPFEFVFKGDSTESLKFYKGVGDDSEVALENYPVESASNEPAWIRLELKEAKYWDFDSDNPNDKNASIDLRLTDVSGSQSRYTINFVTLAVDEAPALQPLTSREYAVDEEQNVAALNLNAFDPEGAYEDVFWKLPAGVLDNDYFELRANGDSGSTLFAANNIGIYFSENPNFEAIPSKNEYNCTLIIKDTQNSGYETMVSLGFSINDINDAPRPTTAFSGDSLVMELEEIEEDTPRVDWPTIDLQNYFTDEDEDPIRFDELIFEHYIISSTGILSFTAPPDYESDMGGKIPVNVVVRDEQNLKWEGTFEVQFSPIDEPPLYNLGNYGTIIPRFTIEEDTNFTANSASTTSPAELVTGDEPNKLSLYLKDPEGLGVTINEQTVNIIYPEYFEQEGLEKNAQFQTSSFAGEEKFTFSPPANAPGLYVVQFDAIAGVGPVFTDATFEFNVTDVSDPPVIDYEVESPNEINPDLANVPSYVQNTTDESDRIIVFAHEGESGPLLNLRANDLYDRISPHGGDYEWFVVGLDSTAFKLVQESTRGEQTNYLKWQTIPDFGNPPLSGNPYTFSVKLKEDSAPDVESDELKLEVWLISIPNERPQFVVDEFDYYRSKSENNTDPFIMVVNAFDPDADDEPDYVESPISYVIVPEKGDADRFEINATTRELSFDFSSGWSLDYENTIDADQDRVFEVLLRATKESMPNEPTDQWIRVQVENVVEPPVFTNVQNAYVDANFSIIEQTEDVYFEIFAESVDAIEKEVNLSLSTETADNDNQFFEVIAPSSNSLKFAFQVPPDFENPIDLDGDNNYTVSVIADCAGSTTTQLFTIQVEDVLFYPEIQSIPADNSSSLSNQVISENESYILRLDVEDPENSEEHRDLLFLTSTNFGFMPVVPGASQSTLDLVEQKQSLFPASDELFSGRHIMYGDVRNVGTNDVIILDHVSNADQRIRYFKNANGFGNFEEVVEVSETLSEKLDGWIPNHGAISDVDDDGDLDLIISAYGQGTSSELSRIIILLNDYDYTSPTRINFSLGVDSFLTLSSDQVSGIDFPILQSGLIRKLAVLDVDSDYDLDLVAIHSGVNGVVWYENSTDWSKDVIGIDFRFGGTIANKEDHGITEPTLLETFDGSNYQNTLKADNFRSRDILISGEEGIFQASPEVSTEGVTFTVSQVVDAVQLNGEVINSMKVAVFYPDSQNRHGVIFSCMDGNAYFLDDLDSSAVTDLDSSNVGSVSVLHAPDHAAGFPSLFLCEGGDTISIFTSDDESIVPEYSKQGTLNLDIIEPVISFSFVDLNRRWTFLDYEIEDTIGFFDKRRIKGDGRLFFKTLPDFDAPKGSGNGTINSNYYEAKIIVRKAHYPDISATRKVLVRIKDVDEPPLFDSFLRNGQADVEVVENSSTHQHEENVLEVFSAINVINPEEGESIEFSIVSGSDSALFQIDASSGKLDFREHPNFVEGSTVTQKYEVVIRVEEVNQTIQFSEHSLEIILNDGSELPFFRPTADFDADSNTSWELNASNGSLVVEIKEDGKGYTFSLVDFNASDQNNELIPPPAGSPSPGILSDSFSIENAPEYGIARFSDDNLSLLYDPDPDFFGTDELTIKVLNTAGHPAYQKMLFHVLGEPDLPKAQMPSSVSVEEGQLRVISLNGYDPDATSVSWSLGSGFTDDFVISNNVLYFKSAPDYEDSQWSAGSALEVSLLLSSNGDTIEHLLNIDLENINDLPPASILDAAKTAQLKVPENQSRLVDLEVSDPDGLVDWDGYYVVQVVDSPDADYFEIAREVILINGENTEKFYLQTKSSSGLDYENPVDANKNNRYDINIFIGKNPLGSSPENQLGENYPVTVSIINQDETKPYFLSGDGSDFYQVSMPENEVFAAQVEAYDPPEVAGSSLTYSLSGGDDIEEFRINQQSGLVYFNQGPNYESPSDLNRDNAYEVQVKATEGVHHIYQNVVITVQDANDFPHVIEAVHYGTEDQTYEGNLTFTDEDGDAYDFVSYNLPEFGELQLFDDYTFKYTPPADFATIDTFTVTLADPYGEATRVVEISLAPVNDPPVAEDDYVFYTNLKRSNRLQFNVLANDHPGVDAPAEESYTLVSHTQTDYSQGLTNLGNGSFSYTPAAGFLGEDTFTYIVADQNDSNSRSTGTVRIWIAKTADLPEWTYLRHFGAYMETKNGWIYHEKLGWLYTEDPMEIIMSASWIWSEEIGWFWTGEKYFNWIYVDDLIGHSGSDEDRDNKWLLWQGDLTKNNNWFLKDKTDKIYSKDDFTRLKIRNEILEKNLDLAGLTQYILDHEYFSRSQVVSIIGELNRYNHSSTLNQILEFDFQY